MCWTGESSGRTAFVREPNFIRANAVFIPRPSLKTQDDGINNMRECFGFEAIPSA